MPAEQHWVYFTNEEVKGLVPEFVAKLDMARKIAGIPFIITSGLRTPEKNQSIIGAVPESSHLKGLAVDLSVSNSHDVSRIIDAARKVGITRRGIYVNAENIPTHIHLDVDLEKPTDVLWVKKEGQAVSPTVTV